MKSQIVLFCMPLVILALQGCGVSPGTQDTSSTYNRHLLSAIHIKDDNKPDPDSEVSISQAASSVSHSLRQLAEIEHANRAPTRMTPQPDPVKIGMADTISVDWTGPVEPLLKQIGKAAHYKIKTYGRPTAIPTIVSLHTENAQIVDILQDIIYQTQNSVDIVRNSQARVIELRYPNA